MVAFPTSVTISKSIGCTVGRTGPVRQASHPRSWQSPATSLGASKHLPPSAPAPPQRRAPYVFLADYPGSSSSPATFEGRQPRALLPAVSRRETTHQAAGSAILSPTGSGCSRALFRRRLRRPDDDARSHAPPSPSSAAARAAPRATRCPPFSAGGAAPRGSHDGSWPDSRRTVAIARS